MKAKILIPTAIIVGGIALILGGSYIIYKRYKTS